MAVSTLSAVPAPESAMKFLVPLLLAVPLQAGEPWRRHTIDDSSRGADGIRVQDINADGRPDLVTGWEEGGRIRVYLHLEPGAVKQPWPAVTVGEVRSPEDAVFADLDGDGFPEVVSCCEGGERSIFFHWCSDPAEPLEERNWRTTALPGSVKRGLWMFCLPLPVDGQHGLDLVAGSKGPEAAIGWWQAPADPRQLAGWNWHPIYQAGWIMSLFAEDMNGDGHQDIVTTDRKGKNAGCWWLENPGPAADQTQPWKTHAIGGQGQEVMFLSRGDLNQDGRGDFCCAVRAGPVLAFLRRGDGTFETLSIPLSAGCGSGKATAVTDVDQDGVMDLLVTCEQAEQKHGVFWLRGSTSGGWEFQPVSGTREGVKFDLIQLLDLDGDGDLDLLTCEERDQLGVIWYENPTR